MSELSAAAPRSRALRWIAVWLLLAWALAIGWQQNRADASSRTVQPAGAAWIWARGPWKWRAAPVAFFAACDFSLSVPSPDARLLALGDEAFLLWVNGRLVASGEYRAGAGLGVLPLADRVRVGGNRLVVELRSGRGPGGFLAAVQAAGTETVHCPSGPAWRVFRSSFPGLVEGWAPLVGGEAPLVWGRPPMGRWGPVAVGAPLARWDRALTGAPALSPRSESSADLEVGGDDARSSAVRALDQIFDWGEEVEGILELTLADDSGGRVGAARAEQFEPAVVRFSRAPPPVHEAEATLVVPVGEQRWRDAVPRRFRYARIVGFVGVEAATVVPVASTLVPALAMPAIGVLGFPPPLLSRSAVAEEIRRRLKPSEPKARGR